MTQLNSIIDNVTENPVIGQMEKMGHEQILFCNDNKTGLKAIIAVHNTVLGPSLGGTRMWPYQNEMEALKDVLRLSRGMTYKSSLAGLDLGGGKAVIIGDSRKQKSEALFRRFGEFVDSLGGKYITAEDVGISVEDMAIVNKSTNYVAGLPGKGGDPSPVTAYGVYMGMKASAKELWGNDSLAGKTVLVQGVGHVGMYLVELLAKENANILVADIFEDNVKEAVQKYGAVAIAPNDVYEAKMDIYAPCALGATINDHTLPKLTCSIIAGAANNQLADEKIHGEMVKNQGILYAPDYLINAGGIINCFVELGGYDKDKAMNQAQKIYDTTLSIYKLAKEKNIPTYQAANIMAELRIENARKNK
jgi:leucine dehydrogenase